MGAVGILADDPSGKGAVLIDAHRLRMARLSSIRARRAELLAEEATLVAEESKIFGEMAEGTTVNLRTGKRRQRTASPEIPAPTDLARARADRALQAANQRRRLGQ